jgi:phage anti-repressor protein
MLQNPKNIKYKSHEQKIQDNMESWNIKKRKFKEDELATYGFTEEETALILEYQGKLPILQEDNNMWIDARILWEQLQVGRDYTTWIKQQILDMDLHEGSEIKNTPSKGKTSKKGGRPLNDYQITVETAKQIAMVAGVKGGNTSKELKELSKLTRQYFIIIEKAFKNRTDWNYDRSNTLVRFKDLQRAFIEHRVKLLPSLPQWAHMKPQVADFWAINDVIIGMTAANFRNANGLAKNESVRNVFAEQQLEYVTELEHFDADLILVHKVYDFWDRHKKLQEKFIAMTGGD